MQNIVLVSKDNYLINLMQQHLDCKINIITNYFDAVKYIDSLLISSIFIDYDSLQEDKLIIVDFFNNNIFTKSNSVFISESSVCDFTSLTKHDFVVNCLNNISQNKFDENLFKHKLMQYGIKTNSKCFHYLVEMLKEKINNQIGNIMSAYKKVAKKFGCTFFAIEKGIRKGLDDANIKETTTDFILNIFEECL